MHAQDLAGHIADIMKTLSNENKTRWTNGECHSFALALADYVRSLALNDAAKVSLLIGTREGINPDTRRRRRFFTHAVVAVNFGEALLTLDCNYEVGVDASLSWESKWFHDALDAQVVSSFDANGYYDWKYPDESDSSFTWQPVAIDAHEVSRMVQKIDRSRGPSSQEIAYARHQLQSAVCPLTR